MSSLLQCGDEIPCDFGAQGSSTTVLGQTSESPVNTGEGDRINTANDPQYSDEPIHSGMPVNTGDTSRLSSEGSVAVIGLTDSNFTDAELAVLLEFDPLLMSVFGLEDIPFLLSSFIDNLLIDSLAPLGGSFRDMTFLERLCIQEGFPDYQCRQRYGR